MSEKQYSHLIDLNDYPVEWWNKVISLGASGFSQLKINIAQNLPAATALSDGNTGNTANKVIVKYKH